MKIKNIFNYLIIFVLFIIIGCGNVFAYDKRFKTTDGALGSALFDNAIPQDGTIWYQKYVEYTTDGDKNKTNAEGSEFCLNKGSVYVKSHDYYYTGVDVNTGYACAIKNLYKDLDDSGKSKLIAAISKNSDGFNGLIDNIDTVITINSVNYSLYSAIQYYLWNEKGVCPDLATSPTISPTINISPVNSKITWTLIGDYFVSSAIKVTGYSTNGYNINLKNNSINAVVSGNQQNHSNITSSTSNNIYVHVPKDKIINVNSLSLEVTPKYNTTNLDIKVYKYQTTRPKNNYPCEKEFENGYTVCGPDDHVQGNSNNPGFQVLALLYGNVTNPEVLGTTVSLSFESFVGSLKVKKYDSKNESKSISGAKFKLFNSDGKTVAKDVYGIEIAEQQTNENGEIFFNNLKYGNYILKEVSAAQGYELSNISLNITISGNVEKRVSNNPIVTKISKKAISGEDELPGAHIVIYDSTDTIIDEFESTDDIHEIYLGPGTFKLKETVAPEGYQAIETVFNFKVKENGDVELLDIESELFETNKNEITIFNKPIEVEVPSTLSSKSALLLTIAMFDIALGIGILTYVKKNKYQE